MNLIQPSDELVIPVGTVGMQGRMRLRCWRPDYELNRCRIDTGWFRNKLLTSGMNNMATQTSWLPYCHIGTNNTTPVASQTQLLGFIASSNTVVTTSYGAQGAAPYFGWKRKTYRFAVGAGQGNQNIQEAGIGWGASGSTLISRALVIDPITQLATSVTPLADEILDVLYELRYYPPLSDAINGVFLYDTSYNTTTRASGVTSNIWCQYIGDQIQKYTPASTYRAYDGLLGTLEQQPSGNPADHDNLANIVNIGYVNNSYKRSISVPVSPAGWNLGAGIRSVWIYTTAGAFQTQFDSSPGGARIPKTTDYTMIMRWSVSWSEKV